MSLAKGGGGLNLNDKSKLLNYGIKVLWLNGKHMHLETIKRGFNIYMEISMEPNYREGDFNLKPSGGEAGAFNELHDGKDQALTLVLGFFSYNLFGLLFGVEGGLCSSVGAVWNMFRI